MTIQKTTEYGIQTAASLWNFLFPAACLACHVPLAPEKNDFLCGDCRREIRILSSIPCLCTSGSYGHTWEERRLTCELCRQLPESFDSIRSVFPYAGIIGELIRNLKYRQGQVTGRALAQLALAVRGGELIKLRDNVGLNAVVPVPMHYTRRMRRGYNQAACIAEPLAELLDLPFTPNAVRRKRRTPPQVRRASPAERLKNVEGAFDVPCPEDMRGQRILLVDDVMTTGATVASCAAALRDAGASMIHVLTVAKAGGHPVQPADIEMTGK